eukprot:5956352-Prymnesium_polylepis.1
MHLRCCQHGASVLHHEHAVPDAIVDLIAYRTGVSSSSCALNDERRLCAQALPRGTHRIADRGGGARVTGITYALVSNVLERCAARTFLDDPARRFKRDDGLARDAIPSPRALRTFSACAYDNPLFRHLRAWHEQPAAHVYLTLQWEGVTSGLRSFAVTPSAASVLPRMALVFSRAEGETRKLVLKATNDLYPLVMWPLAFPRGERLRFTDGAPVDDWRRPDGRADGRKLNLQQATLLLMLQPERRDATPRDAQYDADGAAQRAPGAFVL